MKIGVGALPKVSHPQNLVRGNFLVKGGVPFLGEVHICFIHAFVSNIAFTPKTNPYSLLYSLSQAGRPETTFDDDIFSGKIESLNFEFKVLYLRPQLGYSQKKTKKQDLNSLHFTGEFCFHSFGGSFWFGYPHG